MTKAELARQLGVSRTYVTLLKQGKRKPSREMVAQLAELLSTSNVSVNSWAVEHMTFNRAHLH